MSDERKVSWVDEQRRDWRFRLWMRYFGIGDRFHDAWLWITDGLVWDFSLMESGEQPRLRHARTGRWLDPDDPRHFGEIGDDDGDES